METIGRWGIFGGIIENRNRYGDPYGDAMPDVEYTRPDGSTLRFWGFYDGGTTWGFRCMPDQTGTWRYRVAFADGGPSAEGTFECVDQGLPAPLAKDSDNPMWFGRRDGGHVLIRSLHVGDGFFARNMPAARRMAFLDWCTAMGYNMLSVASHYLNRDTAGRGRGWDTPRLWPLDRDEFARLEGILNDLLRRGIMVFPFAGFFGRDAFYPNSHREQLKYVRYTMARLGVYRNMLLNVAGPEPLLSVNPFMPKPEVDRLGRLIAEHNAFGLMMSVHNQTGRDAFIDEEYVDYGTLQGPKTLDRRLLHSELMASRRPGKPLYAQETLWPGNGYHVVYGTDDVRRNAIVINMSATALNLADNDGDSSSGFTGTLDTGDAHMEWHTAARGVWDFLETLPFFRMSPHPEMVDRGFCLAEPGVRCLVYLEEGGSVRVNTGKGTYRGVWVNARDTGERIDAGTVSPGSELNVPDGLDWFLLLEHD